MPNVYDFGEPQVHASVYIHTTAVVLGDVTLAKDCSVWPGAIIRGDMNTIEIGERSNVQDAAVLHITHKNKANPEGWPVKIGNDVTIGHKACLHGCTIGNRVLIGINACVLDGAVVPDDIVIGAGSLVPPGKKLESGYLYIGSPAKATRKLSDKELAFFEYSANNYVNLKDTFIKKGI